MLRIGLTGGIGAGKSTVSAMLVDHGAVLIDADRIAREVVAPGQPLLDRLAATFGSQVLGADGALDRAALAAAAFADANQTAELNALMHPAIRDRTAAHFAAHSDADIVVHDVPLLVENQMTPAYHLNLLVDVPADLRLHRLMSLRGMDRADAQARISRQADDDTRRRACDVIVDNSGPVESTRDMVRTLITARIRPFAENLRLQQRAERGGLRLCEPGEADWAGDAERIIAKLRHGTDAAFPIEHIGSTAVPGLPAKDVIDLQLIVADLAGAQRLAPRLAALGFPGTELHDHLGAAGIETKWFHANADPGRDVNLHVRTADSVGVRFARAFLHLLRTDAGERERYLGRKRELVSCALERGGTDEQINAAYAEAKEAHFLQLRRRLVPDSFS